MPSFVISGSIGIAQSLTGNQTGVLTGSDSELVVSGADAIATSGFGVNYIYVGGLVLANSISVQESAIQAEGSWTEISVGPTGVLQAFNADTIDMRLTATAILTNAGTILSGEDAVDIRPADLSQTTTISNSGLIQGGSDGLVADAGAASLRIVNTGTIIGEGGFGIFANWQFQSFGTATLNNSGTIIGNSGSYTASSGLGQNIIQNAGLMVGDIFLSLGDDLYNGTSGRVQGTVFGGQDNDRLIGGEFVDLFDGGTGDDILRGHGGDDLLVGDDGADTLSGGDGDDAVDGGNNPDMLRGGYGDDALFGGNGGDTLRGDDGQDTLDGGAGQDVLFGGDGADVFVLAQLNHSAVGATRDRIMDFEQDEDIIDLSALPATLTFLGTGVFTGTAREVRLSEAAAGNTVVQIDGNADGVVDAQILVAGVTGLTADDFIL